MIDDWLLQNPQPTMGKGQYMIKLSKVMARHNMKALSPVPTGGLPKDADTEDLLALSSTSFSKSKGKRRRDVQESDEEAVPEPRRRKRTKSTSVDGSDDGVAKEELDAEAMMLSHLAKAAQDNPV